MKTRVMLAITFLMAFGADLFAEIKVEKDVAYGAHERNVMDIYWDTEYENAPIVFTIHGGSFKHGSKVYCNRDMQKLYLDKGCVVVSPNYRLLEGGGATTIADCMIDCAMAVAYMQANAEKYGGDPTRIVTTGGSAGAYLSASLAYRKSWEWPDDAKYKPEKLNVIAWYGDSGGASAHILNSITENDPPAFMIFGEREHPATPAEGGHKMQAVFNSKGVWSKMVYVENGRHCPGKQVLVSPQTRDKTVFDAFNQFLDMVCYSKGKPKGGDVITVVKKK